MADRDVPDLEGRLSRIGAQAGAQRLGATLYEIAPGAAGSPLHAHYADEALIVVLGGSPVLRTPEGHRCLVAGEVVACLVGRRGAHQLVTQSAEPVRVLVVSTMVYPDIFEMPDGNKVPAQAAPPGSVDRLALAFPRDAAADRLTGEPSAGSP